MEDNFSPQEVLPENNAIGNQEPSQNTESYANKTYVSAKEKWWYIAAISFYSMFSGMINGYRSDFLTNVVGLNEGNQQIMNVVTNILGFVIFFFITWLIENSQGKKGKFKTISMVSLIPYALFGFMIFYVPFKDGNSALAVSYVIIVWLIYGALNAFIGTMNNISMVMTPNETERNQIISSKNFFRSIMNSAPLVIVLVLGFIIKAKTTLYLVAMAVCSVSFVVVSIINFRYVQERIPLLQKKRELPFKNMLHILKNKNYLWATFSNLVMGIYKTGTAVGIFLSAAFFKGDTSKYVLFGLPTGIGTFVGMIFVRIIMKKKSNIFAYKFFGIYSLVINSLAFLVGYFYFTTESTVMLVLFFIMLFPVGLQFGSSNLLPEIFNADILNEIELQTGGKRLEQTMSFTSSFFGMLVGIITGLLGPIILFTFSNYQQSEGDKIIIQSRDTNIMLLFFYTVYAGIFYALSILPILGYNLTAKRRKEIMDKLEVLRAERAETEASDKSLEETSNQ